MEELLQQIEKALNSNLYYLALHSTLALPDICAALISPDGKTSGKRYIDWYNSNAKESSPIAIDGENCYKYRCSVLHQGSSQHDKSDYTRIIFIEPSISNFVCHNNIINGALNIDLRVFCNNMISSVRNWIEKVHNNPTFEENYKSLIKRYPDGLSPYIGGIPVIS